MRVLVFHGYLLRGTGSNVYNARLCAALARAGHSVDLLCQEPRPEELDFVDAVGTWEERAGEVRVTTLREPVRVTVVAPGHRRPAAGLRRRPLRGLRGAHAAGVQRRRGRGLRGGQRRRGARRRAPARGPTWRSPTTSSWGRRSLARGLGGAVPYAVKVHGSALEYVVKRDPERFLPWAREGLARARDGPRRLAPHGRVAVGGDAGRRPCPGARGSGRPGVDVDEFRPRDDAGRGGRGPDRAPATASEDDGGEGAFARDAGAAGERPARAGPRPRPPRRASSASSSSPRASTCCWRRGRSCPEARLGGRRLRRLPRRPARAARRAGRRRPRRRRAPSRRPGASSRAARERRCAICWPSSTAAERRLLGRGRATCASASSSPGAWSTTSSRRCWPPARRWSSPARSPRPTGWWPPRRRRAACCRSPPGTPGCEGGQRDAGGGRPAAGARLAVVPDRRRRGAGDRRARARVAAGAGRRARAATRAALVGHGARALLVGGRGRAGSSRRRRDGWRSCRPWPEIECRADGSRALQTRPASRIRRPCGGGRRARAERLLGAGPRPTTPTSSRASSCSCRSAAPATCSRAPAPRAPRGRTSTRPSSRRSRTGCRARTSPARSTARSCIPTATASCRPSSSRATRPTTSPPTWRSRSPPAARTRALLATAVKQAGGGKPAVEKNGNLQIDADPTGQLAFVTDTATGTPGQITVKMQNKSGTPHDIVIDGKGKGEIVQNGGVVAVPGRLHGRELHVLLLGARATARPACRASSPSSSAAAGHIRPARSSYRSSRPNRTGHERVCCSPRTACTCAGDRRPRASRRGRGSSTGSRPAATCPSSRPRTR